MSEEAPQTEETIDRKDVTPDFLIDDLTSEKEDRPGGEVSAEPLKEKGDHPVITILDMAVKQSGEYLRKQNLPPANNAVYESFSKPFLNEACWHYMPDGSLPDDPRLALVLGVGGLGLAFAPTLIAVYHRKEEEEKRKEQEKKRRKQREQKEKNDEEGEEEENRGEENRIEEVEPPDWMTRMEGGALPGM